MSYDRQSWVDGASGGTPLSAARLAHMETGIGNAADEIAGRLSDAALGAAYIAPAGKTTTGAAAALPFYNAADYGLKADNGVTDNASLLTALLAAVPDGATIRFPGNGLNNYYGFGSTVTVNRPVTLEGNWGRATSGAAPAGTLFRPLTASTFGASSPLLHITTNRVKLRGLALIGTMARDTAATTNGTTTVQLSGLTAASWMVGCPVSGSDVPLAANAPTTITAVNTTTNTITLSAAATGSHSGTDIAVYSGQGVKFGANSHQSKAYDLLVTTFAVGINMGTSSDHITVHDSEMSGSYDNVLFDQGNLFDYGFYDCNLTAAAHAGARLYGPNTSVQNVLFSRCHLGFAPYGIVQDATSSGDGYSGLRLDATPIESITKQHLCIVNGGSIAVDPSSYWGWDNTDVAKPALPAFQITGLQDFGPIDFWPQLLTNHPNPNCPWVIQVANQNGFPIETHGITAGAFAQKVYQFTAYTGRVEAATAYFQGQFLNVGNQTVLNVGGGMQLHSTTKSANYTTVGTDAFVRCTATMTLTLAQNASPQLLVVTNESASGTVTLAVSAGTYVGPATIAAAHGATFISDGTNWRCVGTY